MVNKTDKTNKNESKLKLKDLEYLHRLHKGAEGLIKQFTMIESFFSKLMKQMDSRPDKDLQEAQVAINTLLNKVSADILFLEKKKETN